VGPGAGLDKCGKSRPTGIRSPDLPARSESLYRTEMSTRNISRGKDGRCVGLTTLPPSYADCLEIWEPQTPVMGLLYLLQLLTT
jgi:hypothetical protein